MRKLLVILTALAVSMLPLVVMSPAQAKSYGVTIVVPATVISKGQAMEFQGKLTPATPNKTVYIQRLKAGKWVNVTKDDTNGNGYYSKVITPPGPGTNKYRATTSAKGSYSGGTSPTKTITVYAWLDLMELKKVSNVSDLYVNRTDSGFNSGEFGYLVQDGNESSDDAWLNNDAVDGFGYGRTQWDLNGKCSKIRGRAGIDDTSDSGAIGRLKIVYDDGGYYKLFFGGDSEEITRSLYATDKLTIASNRESLDDSTVVGFGEPQVFCKAYLPRDTPVVE